MDDEKVQLANGVSRTMDEKVARRNGTPDEGAAQLSMELPLQCRKSWMLRGLKGDEGIPPPKETD